MFFCQKVRLTPRTWGLKILTISGNLSDLGALGENQMCDYTGYILGFVSSYVFYNHQLHPQTPCRHLQTPSRHQQTPPRHPSDIIQTPFRHSTNAFYGHFGFYQSISLNPPYNTSGTPETPIDTHRHHRHPLYSLQTTSRHPPDALYSHRWCPNKIVQCTLHMP